MKYNGRSDRTIKPGKTEKLVFYFDSSRYSESFARRFRVTTNDPSHPNETLKCNARILQPVKLDQRGLKFGAIRRFSPAQYKTVTIRRGDGPPIAPELLPISNPAIEAQLCEIEPGEVYELEVAIGAPWPKGRFKEYLAFKTGVEEVPEARVQVTGSVKPRVSAAPHAMVFPALRTRQYQRSTTLRWDDDKPGKILAIESSFPDSTVRVEEKDGKQKIILIVPPGGDNSRTVHAVTMRTDDPEAPVFAVSVMGQPETVADKISTSGSRNATPKKRGRSGSGISVRRTE